MTTLSSLSAPHAAPGLLFGRAGRRASGSPEPAATGPSIRVDSFNTHFDRSQPAEATTSEKPGKPAKTRGFGKGVKQGLIFGGLPIAGGLALMLTGVGIPIGCAVMALSPVMGFAGFLKGLIRG